MWWRSSWGSGQVPLVLLASLLESRDSIEGAWDLTTDERRDGDASTSGEAADPTVGNALPGPRTPSSRRRRAVRERPAIGLR